MYKDKSNESIGFKVMILSLIPLLRDVFIYNCFTYICFGEVSRCYFGFLSCTRNTQFLLPTLFLLARKAYLYTFVTIRYSHQEHLLGLKRDAACDNLFGEMRLKKEGVRRLVDTNVSFHDITQQFFRGKATT